jgi:hypothetical protein
VKRDALDQPGNSFRCGLAFRGRGIHAWDYFPMSRPRLLRFVQQVHSGVLCGNSGDTAIQGRYATVSPAPKAVINGRIALLLRPRCLRREPFEPKTPIQPPR